MLLQSRVLASVIHQGFIFFFIVFKPDVDCGEKVTASVLVVFAASVSAEVEIASLFTSSKNMNVVLMDFKELTPGVSTRNYMCRRPHQQYNNGTWIKGQYDQLNETIENTQIHQRLLN